MVMMKIQRLDGWHEYVLVIIFINNAECMRICFCMHKILHIDKSSGILHMQWTTDGNYWGLIISIGVGIGGRTNESRSMAKDADDLVACD